LGNSIIITSLALLKNDYNHKCNVPHDSVF
jgi:hypothetical protein